MLLTTPQGIPLANLTPEQTASIQRRAAVQGMTPSEWMVTRIRANAERFRPAPPLEPKAQITLPLTDEEIRNLHFDALGQGESPDEWAKSLLLFNGLEIRSKDEPVKRLSRASRFSLRHLPATTPRTPRPREATNAWRWPTTRVGHQHNGWRA